MASARLLISKCNGLDTTSKVRECRVHQQVTERVTVCCCYKLHATFCNGARSGGFQFSAYFVDYDDLRHVVLHRLDHHSVLFHGASHLHAACSTDTGVRNVSVSSDFVRGIHDNHAFIGFARKDTSYFTQQGGFSHAWATKYQN